jgi:hypothetical protein
VEGTHGHTDRLIPVTLATSRFHFHVGLGTSCLSLTWVTPWFSWSQLCMTVNVTHQAWGLCLTLGRVPPARFPTAAACACSDLCPSCRHKSKGLWLRGGQGHECRGRPDSPHPGSRVSKPSPSAVWTQAAVSAGYPACAKDPGQKGQRLPVPVLRSCLGNK